MPDIDLSKIKYFTLTCLGNNVWELAYKTENEDAEPIRRSIHLTKQELVELVENGNPFTEKLYYDDRF